MLMLPPREIRKFVKYKEDGEMYLTQELSVELMELFEQFKKECAEENKMRKFQND